MTEQSVKKVFYVNKYIYIYSEKILTLAIIHKRVENTLTTYHE
jgi:hypothetical protein